MVLWLFITVLEQLLQSMWAIEGKDIGVTVLFFISMHFRRLLSVIELKGKIYSLHVRQYHVLLLLDNSLNVGTFSPEHFRWKNLLHRSQQILF